MAIVRRNADKKYGKRSVMLSMIAMLELILLSVSVTFSWFEPPVNPSFVAKDITTVPVLSHSMIEVSSDASLEPIDLSCFFYRSFYMNDDDADATTGVKFSPVSSVNGIDFTSRQGIKLNASEIYAATLSFEFNVDSALECEFWLESLELLLSGETVQLGEMSGDNDSSEDENVVSEEATEESEESVPSVTEASEAVDNSEEGIVKTEVEHDSTEDSVSDTEEFTELPQEEEVESETTDNKKPETKSQNSYLNAFYISFHDGGCDGGINCETNCFVMSFAEAMSALSGDSKVMVFNVEGLTTVRCSIWLSDGDEAEELAGEIISIKLSIGSNASATKTIVLENEAIALSEMYPQMLNDGYYVELIDAATGNVYMAEYDGELDVWCANVPATLQEFTVHYRSRGVDRGIIATWERIDGGEVHSFALYDYGVFLSSES